MEEPTHTAAGGIRGSSSDARAERWSSLPDDLLNIIYLGLVAGPVDRVRFAAVRTSWRAVASRHPPRHVLPWLILDPSGRDKAKHLCCLQAGAVLPRFLLPSKAVGTRLVGSHDGGWVAAYWGWDWLRIVNLFSGADTTLTPKQMSMIKRQSSDNQFVPLKVIISSPPTSRHCILAAITHNHELVICVLGRPWRVCMPQTFRRDRVMDIAFCNGQLFCLMSVTKEIVVFEAILDERGVLVFSPGRLYIQNRLVIENNRSLDDPEANVMYILELRGRLVVATMRTDGLLSWWCNFRRSFFLVFELVDATTEGMMEHRMYKWEQVTSLGNYALFLGPKCAKAIDVSTGERDGLHRNHIYYSHHRCYKQDERLPSNAKEFLTSSKNNGCRVYYKDNKSFDNGVKGITSVGYYVIGGDHPPMWMFPPDL